MSRRLLTLLVACTLAACTVRPTQVLVTVDAEPGVREASQSLGIRIWGRGGDGVFDDEMVLEEQGFEYPWVVALRPQDDDPRRVFRFEATAYAGENTQGAVISQTRMTSGYVDGAILHVYLLLQDSCIGVPCEDLNEACRDGRCQEIPMDPPPFTPEAGLPDGGPPPGTDTCDSSMAEICNRVDDDCDRRVDEGFVFRTDPEHCGGCGRACVVPNGEPACVDAACVVVACDDGWADCDGRADNGCETDTTRPATCGDCETACAASMVCRPSGDRWSCATECEPGQMNCSGSCVDIDTSLMHCGGCGDACTTTPHSTVDCVEGACVRTCDPGWRGCDGATDDADGCETNVDTSTSHCGVCGRTCSGATCRTPVCTRGMCGQMPNTGSSCDTDFLACTLESCDAGSCELDEDRCANDGGLPLDAGRDAGRFDAGRDAGPIDAGADTGAGDMDAGACLPACGSGQECCDIMSGAAFECCPTGFCGEMGCRDGGSGGGDSGPGDSGAGAVGDDSGVSTSMCMPPCAPASQECCWLSASGTYQCCPTGTCGTTGCL